MGVILPPEWRVSSIYSRVCGSHLGGHGTKTLLEGGKFSQKKRLDPLPQLSRFSAQPTLKGTWNLMTWTVLRPGRGLEQRPFRQLTVWDSSTKWALGEQKWFRDHRDNKPFLCRVRLGTSCGSERTCCDRPCSGSRHPGPLANASWTPRQFREASPFQLRRPTLLNQSL